MFQKSLCVILLSFFIAAVTTAMPRPLAAQTTSGSIVGDVTDSSGAFVPRAKVTVTDLDTNEQHTAETDTAGVYRLVNLPPANYRVEVEKAGFKHFAREPVIVGVEGEVRINVPMAVGSLTETVEVTSQTPLLQTESGENSAVVEGQQVQETPLNGRNAMNLVALTPGVVAGAPSGASGLNQGTHTGNGVWADYSIAGGFTGANAMYVDGATDNLLGNPIAIIPTQDAVQEFRIVSAGASPEFGRFGGGVINMATKSGTNQIHGSAYEYLRNNIFNANNFFNNRTDQPRPKWNQNQFGVTFGNAIKKDKLFSFFSWEGFHLLLGVPAATNVPTQALRNGVFTTPIHDPLAAQTGRTGCVTQPTPGTYQIAPSCIDPTATAMLSYWPLPNASTNPNANFISTPVTGNNANQYTERVDYVMSEKQRLFARYTYWTQVDLPFNQLGNFTENAYSHNRSTQGVLGDTYTLNPSSVLDVRLAYVRQYTDNLPNTLGQNLSFLGPAWAALQPQLSPEYYPAPHVLGQYSLYPFFGMEIYSQTTLNDYDLTAGITKIKGNHALKFGGEIRLSDLSSPGTTLQGGGSFVFLGLPFLSGNNFADFLFGTPASGAITRVAASATYNWYQGYYVADTWQVNPKLTFNYGVRWELPGALAERNNKATVLLPNTVDSVTGKAGTLALVDSGLYSSRAIQGHRLDLFSPRFGFAFRPSSSTSLRGSYTLTYYPPDLNAGVLATGSQVNAANTTWNNSPGAPYLTLSNPFPASRFPNGLANPSGRQVTDLTSTVVGGLLDGPVPNQPYPWANTWNLSTGHQFHGDVLLEASYIGSASHNLPTTFYMDQLSSQYFSAGATQSERPYGATFTNVENTNAHIGSANYNALELKAEKRFRGGGVVTANYTFSKNLGNVESPSGGIGNNASSSPNSGNYVTYLPQDYNNFQYGEYALSSFDVPQHLVINYVYDLPFGDGKQFAHYHGLAGRLVSGWSVNGITNFQKGFPMSIIQSGNVLTQSFGAGQLRPNKLAGCNPTLTGSGKNRLNMWFNTSCYAAVGQYSLGNESRSDPGVRTDGIDNWDLAFVKSTKIVREANLQFRAEMFNTFNHPQFAAPANEIDGAAFGAVTAQQNSPRLIQFSLRVNY